MALSRAVPVWSWPNGGDRMICFVLEGLLLLKTAFLGHHQNGEKVAGGGRMNFTKKLLGRY